MKLGQFSDEAISKARQLTADKMNFSEGDAEVLDFGRCQRPDGSYYGTGGQCRKGKEVGAREFDPKKLKKATDEQLSRLKNAGQLDASTRKEVTGEIERREKVKKNLSQLGEESIAESVENNQTHNPELWDGSLHTLMKENAKYIPNSERPSSEQIKEYAEAKTKELKKSYLEKDTKELLKGFGNSKFDDIIDDNAAEEVSNFYSRINNKVAETIYKGNREQAQADWTVASGREKDSYQGILDVNKVAPKKFSRGYAKEFEKAYLERFGEKPPSGASDVDRSWDLYDHLRWNDRIDPWDAAFG